MINSGTDPAVHLPIVFCRLGTFYGKDILLGNRYGYRGGGTGYLLQRVTHKLALGWRNFQSRWQILHFSTESQFEDFQVFSGNACRAGHDQYEAARIFIIYHLHKGVECGSFL